MSIKEVRDYINGALVDNNQGLITPRDVRGILLEMIAIAAEQDARLKKLEVANGSQINR